MNANLAASVRARLLNLAKAEGSDFNQVLRFCRLEARLSRAQRLLEKHGYGISPPKQA
ncbi:hypothetical protein GCM10027046_07220 [Uliginosibacterium flavum]|uniref:Uncharacterized protein n=1 Tax=Uliginosibacterium flavum TaxID=1396831 RepID=A0ABV2TNT5_9RHOO